MPQETDFETKSNHSREASLVEYIQRLKGELDKGLLQASEVEPLIHSLEAELQAWRNDPVGMRSRQLEDRVKSLKQRNAKPLDPAQMAVNIYAGTVVACLVCGGVYVVGLILYHLVSAMPGAAKDIGSFVMELVATGGQQKWNTPFALSLALGAVLNFNILQWSILDSLGWSIQNPRLWHSHSGKLILLNWGFSLAPFCLVFAQNMVSWEIALIGVIMIKWLVKSMASARACNQFRLIHMKLLQGASAFHDAKQIEAIQTNSTMTDSEIIDTARRRARLLER